MRSIILAIAAIFIAVAAQAADVFKMNPHTGKLDNTGPSHATLDKIGESGGYPTWNGGGWLPSSETQNTILDKLSTPTDGAILAIQQGPTEPATANKFEVRDAAGNLTMVITATGAMRFFNVQ